jgi:uncharacterized protein (UPF0147 family)
VTHPNEKIVITFAQWEAVRTMLAALIEVANDPDTPTGLRGMVFAVIAQAEAAGIQHDGGG